MLRPRDHLRPPCSLRAKKDPSEESDDWDRIQVESNQRLLERGLLARGFYLDKGKSVFWWRGGNGLKLTYWYVTSADRDFSKEVIEQILTAIDMGAKSIDTEWDDNSEESKLVVRY